MQPLSVCTRINHKSTVRTSETRIFTTAEMKLNFNSGVSWGSFPGIPSGALLHTMTSCALVIMNFSHHFCTRDKPWEETAPGRGWKMCALMR